MRVFEALADPTRREILQRLLEAERPLSVNEVTESFDISRQAVTRHLDILEANGLIRARRDGRERLHEIDPAPLREVERWLQPFAAAWDRRTERLRRHLERRPHGREG